VDRRLANARQPRARQPRARQTEPPVRRRADVQHRRSSRSAVTDRSGDVGDEIAPRQPCPCGSGKRYKSCHGAGDVPVARPFEGLAGECDWIALRELVPSATAPLRLGDPPLASRAVTLATLLPDALPAMVRPDGHILLGLQVHARSGDVSRDIGHALEGALTAEPGTTVPGGGRPGRGPRLQDLLDPAVPLRPVLHEDFGFWLSGAPEDQDAQVRAALERANAAIVPTARLSAAEAAYWCRIGEKAHLRWVMPQEEDTLLDALARLAAEAALGLGEGTRYAGSFRAHGRLVPVWDLPADAPPGTWEQPAADFDARLAAALAAEGPLPASARRARDGLRGRQLTLR
jgi:Family of unknown function (DUF5926)/SEC-C motif